ncbi:MULTISPECIES: hypothetical protein [Vibrio]|jgi:uncharacterized sodium:solute symporter family permease YidK|uniref:Uncharacterized protein n=1 Tax=Vibrio natriegens NBRC 15636 = ATCC 14048 = DSM 759 TaxID=1219067 RepID=A0AAN0Y5E6_VIBNA|nr:MULTISPECIES: hypothetical protein [Vibrio]MEE3876861.1 hypothetical protein [Vibrio sp. YYF0003]CAH0527618.1 hypothetical protein CTH30272_01262 [Catenococcus thiocycli]AEX24464.1 hypothetical protein VEJY3_20236 [Vibrio sp. EJY3]ALR18405.1 hypothetical protein PN96_20980 [Vibrio natriegens NBRC 15636 = ATCC 14048 = DSM 759]ANQ14352.1 hypothetical protein BA890_16475 [Vibrio natriegens NBRC 15636 = ATCC 14048 = DSM 759]
MHIQPKTINNVLIAMLMISIFGLIAMYNNNTQQNQEIEQLRGQLIEKENQIVVSNEALSYTRYQHQLLAEDYNRYRDEQSMSNVLSQ